MITFPSVLLVFSAGFLSFLSPCILPLIPSYMGILGAFRLQNTNALEKKFVLFFNALSFVLGFTGVFISLSIVMSATFWLMGGISAYIRSAAGIIVIVLGLNILFNFIPFLNYEKRLPISGKFTGKAGVFLAGAAFGAGWTPCIGPILAATLFLAGQSGKAGIAAMYLGVYSLGLSIPFLLAALYLDRFILTAPWFRGKMAMIQRISAIVIMIMGLFILTGRYSALNNVVMRWQFTYIEWSADKSLLFRMAGNFMHWLTGL